MRALLAQLTPRSGDVIANVETVATTLAAHPDAELAIFPELFLCGYLPDAAGALALEPDGVALDTVRRAAAEHRTAVLVGFIERLADGHAANAVACIDHSGQLVGVYRKAHLFGAREQAAFTPGDAYVVVRLAGTLVAPLICFDVEFPEPARAVTRAGAQLLVTVAANMSPYGADHALAARARALDNRRPHVYVNRSGVEGGLRFCGESAVIGPDGAVACTLDEREGTLEVALPRLGLVPDLDTDYLSQLRDDLPVHVAEHALRGGGTR